MCTALCAALRRTCLAKCRACRRLLKYPPDCLPRGSEMHGSQWLSRAGTSGRPLPLRKQGWTPMHGHVPGPKSIVWLQEDGHGQLLGK